jgi:uncharacterized lipoprotein YajG
VRLAVVAPALAALACAVSGEVALVHRPPSRPPLEAAGVHRMSFAVEVHDERPGDDPRLVAQPPGWLGRGTLRSRRDVALDVREALETELRSRDLRVVEPARSDLLVRVRLEHLWCSESEGGRPARADLLALVDAMVAVVDAKTGRLLLEEPFTARAESRAVSFGAMQGRYERVLNEALARFAARVVRHPDFLIAAQKKALD